jgi:hypothetical protein
MGKIPEYMVVLRKQVRKEFLSFWKIFVYWIKEEIEYFLTQ